MARRQVLSVGAIVEAAVRVADRGGLAQVSLRNVGRQLGVQAMSLYRHLSGKEALPTPSPTGPSPASSCPSPHSPGERR